MKVKEIDIDPWSVADIEARDYSRLFEEFGISRFEPLLARIEDPHLYMRRGIIMGHRGYEDVVEAMHSNEKFGVMSGFMPSGRIHLGGKMVMDEIIWHQERGGEAFACIADMESHSVRGLSWDACRRIGVNEYILSLIALGFDIDRGHIYFQSTNRGLRDFAFELGQEVNFSELSAIYGFQGDVHISHMMSILVQNADILQPQLLEYGGPKPVVIPVGVDQDPHIRLTRDIAARMRLFRVEKRYDEKQRKPYISIREKQANKGALDAVAAQIEYPKKVYQMHIDVYIDVEGEDEGEGGSGGGNSFETAMRDIDDIVRAVELEYGGYGFFPPAATYHRFMRGLTGGKMSSSIPNSYIALTEPPEDAAAKVRRAKTGGRATVEEQKRLGGSPEECTVYELLMFHLIPEDAYIKEIFEECKNGVRTCKSCKSQAAELMSSFIRSHQEERAHAREILKERGLYKQWLDV